MDRLKWHKLLHFIADLEEGIEMDRHSEYPCGYTRMKERDKNLDLGCGDSTGTGLDKKNHPG